MKTREMLRKGVAIGALLCASVLAHSQDVPQQVTDALKEADAKVEAIIAIPKDQRTFENTIGALDLISVELDRKTSMPLFMQYVSTDANVREGSRKAEEVVSNWAIELGKNERLYKAVKEYAEPKPSLTGEKARLLMFILRDYRRDGMDLPKDKRDRLKEIEKDLTKLAQDFQKNIYEDPTQVYLTKEELKGVPDEVLKTLKQSEGLYLVGMDGPTFNALMDYAEIERTRQRAWLAYKRRGGKKNVDLLEKILKLRSEQAQILGYKNYVDYAIETRMAKNSETVADFYKKLRPIVRKKAVLDMKEFTEAKRRHTRKRDAKLYPWDYSFYKTRLMKEKYAVDSEKVAEYFPMEQVVKGLFELTSRLYNIEYREATADAGKHAISVWHPDVKFYEVYDKSNGELMGRFYLDLFPRESKYNHAAVWGLWPRRVLENGQVHKPLAAMVTNFTKPTADKPSLLPHDEVETFFHEFGHLLHHMLGQGTTYGRFSGTAVARDFVEAPSQMMENWVWAPEVLNLFAKHYKTGEPLPNKMLDGMKAARTLGSGIEAEHQFYYALVDQAFHTDVEGDVDTTKVSTELFSELELYDRVPEQMFHAAFGHLMGYQGAYYGYMWSLVYAQDLFQRFEELGLTSPEAGKYYREKVLNRGGSMDEMDMIKDYLGRDPNMEAFLRHLGLEPEKPKK